jgi:hypothetical protein
MDGRMPHGWWTAYRQFLVRTLLARDESRALIAQRVGCTRQQLNSAIGWYDLKPRPLLACIAERGGATGFTRCEGCGVPVERLGHCRKCRVALRRSGLDPDTNELIRRKREAV